MKYKIYPMNMGENAEAFDMNSLIYRYPIGQESYSIGNGFFGVRDENGKWFLVDTGTGSNEECMSMGKPSVREPRGFLELLAEHGIAPEEIETVIMTHLHWDHAHNLDKLPNARFYVQRAELNNAVCPNKHERPTYGYMGLPGFMTPRWMRVADHMVCLDGDTELMPGVRCVFTPGHTAGSQTVLIDTAEGTYALVGDHYYFARNFEEDALIGVFCSHDDWYRSSAKLKYLGIDGAHVITTHDHVTYEHGVYG